jgi:uncharacterized protein (TIGR00299 family) protein
MPYIAYVDCFSGASGDMLLGAWLDAGLSFEDLKHDIALLGLPDYDLAFERKARHGICGTKFDVHDRGHDRPAHNLSAVRAIIETSSLPDDVITPSLLVFERLARAEAAVHGVSVEEIHFHELGAVDSLVDIVGFCAALRRMEVETLYASPLPTGSGTVHTEHGPLPVPAPATLALLAEAGAPIIPSPARSELVTPTGAALLSALAQFAQPAMRVQRVGYGFGSKEFAWPNLLRIWIGEPWQQASPQSWMAEWPKAEANDEGHSHAHGHAHDHDHPHHHTHDHDQEDVFQPRNPE